MQENDPHKPETITFGLDKVIMNLQRELQKAQREKDVLTDLRSAVEHYFASVKKLYKPLSLFYKFLD